MYSSPRSNGPRGSDRSGSAERRPYTPRSEGSDRAPRSFSRDGGSDRGYAPRTDSSERRPYTPRGESSDRTPRSFERKPYAGKPRPERNVAPRSSERGLDPRQMRYQVIGRTTDESDLIVQISPAFYEYVRSMAHQGVKAPRVEEDKPRYNKFDHPYHADPLHTSYDKVDRKKPYEVAPKKKAVESWDDDDIDVDAIDAEMDDEYEMIKQGFANLNKNTKKPGVKKTTPKTNRKKA